MAAVLVAMMAVEPTSVGYFAPQRQPTEVGSTLNGQIAWRVRHSAEHGSALQKPCGDGQWRRRR